MVLTGQRSYGLSSTTKRFADDTSLSQCRVLSGQGKLGKMEKWVFFQKVKENLGKSEITRKKCGKSGKSPKQVIKKNKYKASTSKKNSKSTAMKLNRRLW